MNMLRWFQPLLVCLTLAGLLPLIHRQLHPRVSAVVLAANVVWISTVGVIGIWLLSLRYLAHVRGLADRFWWCSMIVSEHGTVSKWVGLPAAAATLAGIVRAVRYRAALDEGELAARRIAVILSHTNNRRGALAGFVSGLGKRDAATLRALLEGDHP